MKKFEEKVEMIEEIISTAGMLAIIFTIIAFIGALAILVSYSGTAMFITVIAMIGLVTSVVVGIIAAKIGWTLIDEMEETED